MCLSTNQLTLKDIFKVVDAGKVCLSVCLNLSVAFDTVDLQLLPSRLSKSFDVSGTALSWPASNPSNWWALVQLRMIFLSEMLVSHMDLFSAP